MRQRFRRSFDALERVFAFTARFFVEERIDSRHRFDVDLAIEEIFTNMVKFHPRGSGEISIGLERAGDELQITLRDFDVDSFDVSRAGGVDVSLPLEERRPGGLGLHLTRKVMDEIRYEYRDRCSTVTLIKRLECSAMFEIKRGEHGELVLSGRLDASKVDRAAEFFDALSEPTVVDLRQLDYISSTGLGLLIKTQKRLREAKTDGLRLVNVNPHINDIFRYAGFHHVFDIEPAAG